MTLPTATLTNDENYVPDAVKTILQTEFDANLATYRDLDEPHNVRQPQARGPFIGAEFHGGSLMKTEYGDFGENAWDDEGAFQLHVFIRKDQPIRLAKTIMTAAVRLFIGRHYEGINFMQALAPFVDLKGEGVQRGVSRSIEYRYEFRGR